MRAYDQVVALLAQTDPLTRRYGLARAEELKVDFELHELLGAVGAATGDPDAGVRAAASRSRRRIVIDWHAFRYDLRRETSSSKTGTWTAYALDRAEMAGLKKLSQAKGMDLAALDPRRLRAAALSAMAPAVERVLKAAREGLTVERRAAVLALAQLDVPGAVEAAAEAAKDPEVRVAAAGALADLGGDQAMDALLALCDAARGEACFPEILIELRAFDRDRARKAVLGALKGAKGEVAAAAAQALKNWRVDESERALLKLLQQDDEGVRLFALDALGRVGTRACIAAVARAAKTAQKRLSCVVGVRTLGCLGEAAALDEVTAALRDPWGDVRAQALESLVRLKVTGQDLARLVVPLLKDPDPLVQTNAALALVPVDPASALKSVSQRLRLTDLTSRLHAVYCLGYLQSDVSLRALKQVLENDFREEVALQAAASLTKYPAADALPTLLGLLNHKHASLRRLAARILMCPAFRGEAKAAHRLGQGLKAERDAGVRAAWVHAFATTAEPSQHLLAARLLDDPEPAVQVAALEALDLLGSLDSVRAVEPKLLSTNAEVKATAAVALWNQGELDVIESLVKDLDAGGDRRLAGLRALEELGRSLARLAEPRKYPLLLAELSGRLVAGTPPLEARSVAARAAERSFDFSPTTCAADLRVALEVTDPEGQVIPQEVVAALGGRSRPVDLGKSARSAPFEVRLAEALELFEAEGAAAALPLAEKLVEESGDEFARLLLARVLVAADRASEAEEQLRRTVEMAGGFVTPSLLMLDLAARRGAGAEMREHFERAGNRALDMLAREMSQTYERLKGVAPASALAEAVARARRRFGFVLDGAHELAGMEQLARGDVHASYRDLLLAYLSTPGERVLKLKLAEAALGVGRGPLARHLAERLKSEGGPDDEVSRAAQAVLDKMGPRSSAH